MCSRPLPPPHYNESPRVSPSQLILPGFRFCPVTYQLEDSKGVHMPNTAPVEQLQAHALRNLYFTRTAV